MSMEAYLSENRKYVCSQMAVNVCTLDKIPPTSELFAILSLSKDSNVFYLNYSMNTVPT